MTRLLIGTSGWVYPHWKGTFYPDELTENGWFDYYARHFDTVEINYSFYRLPERSTFSNWKKMAPPGFVFAVKANRYITHRKKLKDAGQTVGKFYENLAGLGDSCGAVLFQLPPRWRVNIERLEEFLSIVPRRYRLVFEFRDDSWLNEDVCALLREYNAALCSADSPVYPSPREVTADFVFYRMHWGHGVDAPDYSPKELRKLAGEIESHLSAGRDAFVYFNNDYEGYAIKDALMLKGFLEKKE